MSELFGLDIQGLVTDSLEGELVPVTITRTVQGGTYNPVTDQYEDGSGNEVLPTEQEFTSEGITPANSGIGAFQSILSAVGQTIDNQREVLVLAKPLGTVPKAGDRLAIDGETFEVTGIPDKDPAGATWTIKVEA